MSVPSEGILLDAPHKQNTQSDRMFISFAPHPCDAKHRFHCVRMVALVHPHMYPLWTWMCHHLGCPPRVVATWVTHSGSRCGVSPTSDITHEVMGRVSTPSGMDATTKHSVRSWFVHSGTSLRLVWFPMSGTHVIRRCPTHHSPQWFVRHWFVQHPRGGAMSVTWFPIACRDHRVWLTPSNP